MQFTYELTIPPNTVKTNPETQVCKLTYGTVKRVFICFPPGPKGLAHIVIKRFESQVWPTNPDGDFAWDNFVFIIEDEFNMESGPFTVKLVGWNEDDTYEHTVTVMFNVLIGAYGLADIFALQSPFSQLEV